jgi:AraC family transcriptional activator FtrA
LVVLAYDGLCIFEFGTALEAFGPLDSANGEPLYELSVAAVDEGPLRVYGGVHIAVDGGLERLEDAGTIVIPGWRDVTAPVPDALIAALQRAAARGCRLVSICTGSFVLAAAGLLSGKRATTHWRRTETLATAFPDILVEPGVLYVDEGDILTSAGSAAGLDLCLYLIRRDYGPEAANRAARRLVIPPHRQGGQAQFVRQPVPVRDTAALAPLLDQLRSRLAVNIRVDALAQEARMSKRTFLRRFQDATGTTPGEWLLGLRLESARSLLETTDLPMEAIAESSGFGSAETMRHHFRTRMGTAPTTYRRQFGRQPMDKAA